MIKRHITPVSRILTVMSVVTHHPVIVLFEGIGRCRSTVDHDLISHQLDLIFLIFPDDLFIKTDAVYIQLNGLSLLRDIDWSEIIFIP